MPKTLCLKDAAHMMNACAAKLVLPLSTSVSKVFGVRALCINLENVFDALAIRRWIEDGSRMDRGCIEGGSRVDQGWIEDGGLLLGLFYWGAPHQVHM